VTGKALGKPMKHQDDIWSVTFSPDGKLIATGSWDRTARLWDARTGKPLGTALQHPGRVNLVAFSSDGKTLLTSSKGSDEESGQVLRWRVPAP
jgi:WD40 repeat protein